MLITIAIPCYRSEHYLKNTVDEIKSAFIGHPDYDYQIILVCDGSPDHTDEIIKEICSEDANITGIILSRNFTQANAKMAAIPYVKGQVMVYMDDDGQHNPADLFMLVEKVLEGNDVVYAALSSKQSKRKALSSSLFGHISEAFNIKPKGIITSSFVAYSRFAVDMLKNYTSPSPTADGYLYSLTTKFANVNIAQRERKEGFSGYNLGKRISLAIEALTNFTIMPLRIINAIGLMSAIIGIVYGIILILKRLISNEVVPGYTSNMVVLFVLGGLVLIGLGVVGEYVGRIYMILSNKPQYVVKEVICQKKG